MPFHLFEPRYRALARDLAQFDGRIGISVLKTTDDHSYFAQTAPIHQTICVGKVIGAEKLRDGTHNILVRGAFRASIVEEVRQNPYRVARVVPDAASRQPCGTIARQMGRKLRDALTSDCGLDSCMLEQWRRIVAAPVQLDMMTDLIAGDFPAAPELRYALLAEGSPESRASMIIQCLGTLRNIRRAKLRGQQNVELARN